MKLVEYNAETKQIIITISADLKTLQDCVNYAYGRFGYEDNYVKIIDHETFAKDYVNWLNRELGEDGTTPVMKMLDQEIVDMIDYGYSDTVEIKEDDAF